MKRLMTRLWEDDLWRLSAVLAGPVPGFAHLEPKRHIPYITELGGDEASTFGAVLQRVTSALRSAAGAEMMPGVRRDLVPEPS